MNYAVADLGTNSARLMIADISSGKPVSLFKTLRSIRIGEGMIKTRRISGAAIERAKRTLLEFKNISGQYNAKEFFCFATSAVREAGNKDEFLRVVSAECGVDIDVISGGDEAVLGFAGSVEGRGGMIDIGGGSTEVIFGSLEDVRFKRSFKIGTVRCMQMFPGGDMADRAAFRKARALAARTLSEIPDAGGFAFTGTGGTATALAAIDLKLEEYCSDRVQSHVITLETAKRLCRMLESMTKEQRKTLPGLEESRADVIVFGAIIMLEFMKAVGAVSITVSDRDNLEGYLSLKLGT